MNNEEYFGNNQQPYYPQQMSAQALPGYGYPIQQPGYAPQQPYISAAPMNPMPPQGGYGPGQYQPQQQPQMQPPNAPIPSRRYSNPQEAWNSYSGSIDATESIDQMNKVLDMINGNSDINAVDSKANINAVLLTMDHLSKILKTPEDWFPKEKSNLVPTFKPSLSKMSDGLQAYIKKLSIL